jgi:hypothetical protein
MLQRGGGGTPRKCLINKQTPCYICNICNILHNPSLPPLLYKGWGGYPLTSCFITIPCFTCFTISLQIRPQIITFPPFTHHFNTYGTDKVNMTNVSKKCHWGLWQFALVCNGKIQERLLPVTDNATTQIRVFVCTDDLLYSSLSLS